MTHAHLVSDLALAWAAAFAGGVIAQRLKQPPILGYLLAGIAIGPFTPGPVIDVHSIDVLAEIGVAFLMFALGAEFSFEEMRRLGRVVIVGGPLQILCTMGLGLLLARPLGLSVTQGVFLGGVLALSSTVVALKVLMGRGELQSRHGRIALGLLIAQDLAVVPLVVLLPTLVGTGHASLADLGLIAIKAAAILLGAYVLGVRIAPWILQHAAVPQTRELFVLGVVGLALGTALVTQTAGLSLAFGAFLAGLVVAESEYRTQVLGEILPLRDLFTSLFFVSVGLLINPATLVSKIGLVALLAATVIVGKAVIVAAIVVLLGMPRRVALPSGLTLAQVGEFSFVLAGLGVSSHAIPQSLFNLVLATSLVTIVASPLLLEASPRLVAALERLPLRGGSEPTAEPMDPIFGSRAIRNHTVICGYGRVGREVAYALEEDELSYLVIEYNTAIVEELRTRGVPVIYGDASSATVLEHASLDSAKLLTVLIPDPLSAELTTRTARALNPSLDILTRATDAEQAERLRQAGATDVVQPEFEAGVAVVGYALRRYGLSGPDLARIVLARRAGFYGRGSSPKRP
jgi:monovalent cation:H+ antiporter-2, CPA2 family